MSIFKAISVLVLVVTLQNLLVIDAKPSHCGCGGLLGGSIGSRCGGLLGGGIGDGCGGSLAGYDAGYGCGLRPTPPISFLPVPQPVPIRVPNSRPQSVTIPNIILALLPPNQNKICRPRPIIRPPPTVVPFPQPYPMPIRSECDSDCNEGPIGYGAGMGGSGGLAGYGAGYGCGLRPTPPISFLPVPQPVPIRVPNPKPQSVTIPNIILALLPPNQNKICRPRPITRPPPTIVPIPQPYPLPIRCGCDSDDYQGPIGCRGGIGCGC